MPPASAQPGRRPRAAAGLLLACFAVFAALAGCGTPSSGPAASAQGPAAAASALPDVPAAPAKTGPLVDPRLKVGEWRHAWQVVGLLQARPPRGRVVLYFGDSTARESVVSDEAWTRQLRGLGAPVRAFTLASHDQTFRIDRRFVEEMPQLHGLALIGVSLSRFVGPPVRGPLGRPAVFAEGTAPRLSHWTRHYYDTRPPKSTAAKQARVVHWAGSQSGKFRRFKTANLRALGKLVTACRRHGLRPVLVQLPLNTELVGSSLARERAALSRSCRAVARRLRVRFLDFQLAPGLGTADFYDMCHLVGPGAAKWQRGLTRWTLRLLPPAPPAGG